MPVSVKEAFEYINDKLKADINSEMDSIDEFLKNNYNGEVCYYKPLNNKDFFNTKVFKFIQDQYFQVGWQVDIAKRNNSFMLSFKDKGSDLSDIVNLNESEEHF